MLGRHVVDFVCKERRLVIELDGGQHAIRFWNNQALEETEAVLAEIQKTLTLPR